jgi:hypothetical protein
VVAQHPGDFLHRLQVRLKEKGDRYIFTVSREKSVG